MFTTYVYNLTKYRSKIARNFLKILLQKKILKTPQVLNIHDVSERTRQTLGTNSLIKMCLKIIPHRDIGC